MEKKKLLFSLKKLQIKLRRFQRIAVGISGFLFFSIIAEASATMENTINESIRQESALHKNNDPELSELINTSIKNSKTYSTMIPMQPNENHQARSADVHAFLFISFSMPETLIKQYLIESKRYHIPLIMRGLIHNSMKETQEKLFSLMHSDNEKNINGGIQIHPISFKKFSIHAVPALVVARDSAFCSEKQSCVPPDFDIVYGNISLIASLSKIAEEGNVGKSFARNLLEQDNG